jgi:hypothetical protein
MGKNNLKYHYIWVQRIVSNQETTLINKKPTALFMTLRHQKTFKKLRPIDVFCQDSWQPSHIIIQLYILQFYILEENNQSQLHCCLLWSVPR